MLYRFLITVVIFSMILYWACTKDKSIVRSTEPEDNAEYIILPGSPGSSEDQWPSISEEEDWFSVINIFSNEATGVPAVVELEGTVYLPIMSRLPSYNNKVVKGYFVPDTNYYLDMRDTIFHVTEHLRDTLVSTWGG